MEKAFTLYPTIQTNPRMGNVSEPSTRHFWNKDIYTHITYADLEPVNPDDEYKKPFTQTVAIGDTIGTATHIIIFKELQRQVNRDSLELQPGDMAIGAVLEVKDIEGKTSQAVPVFVIRDNMMFSREAILEKEGLKLAFTRVDPETKKFDIEVREKRDSKKEFVIMKAIIFPGINLLWSGAVLLIIGTTLAIRKRIRKNKA
jgi:cytochrome c-type biogenesis protein CcmF